MTHFRENQLGFQLMTMERDDDDFGEGFIAESHPLRPTQLTVPGNSSRAPSISSSVTDLDAPIYARETTIPLSARASKEDIQEQPSTPTALAPTSKATTSKEEAGLNARLLFAITAAALGSAFQHGYNTGVVNSPQEIIKTWIGEVKSNRTNETVTEDEVTGIWSIAVSIFCIGGMIGGALVGTIADNFGRKGGLLLNNILVLITVLFEGFCKIAGSYEMIIIGRLVIGINAGFNAGLTPMYLAEISPMHLRGAVGTVYQLIITISILVAQILSMDKLFGTVEHWPLLLCLTIIPAIFQCATLPICPESPKYLLLSKGREVDAQRALSWLRNTNEVYEEMEEMKSEYESMKLVPKVTLKEILVNPALRIPLIISLMVMLAQQLSGINAVMFFSDKIFRLAGLGEAAQSATLGVGAMNVLMTLVSLVLVEKYGRKTLLLIGFGGMVIDTALLTICIGYAQSGNAAASYCSIIFVIMFVVIFAIGPGSIPWFLVSELFNQSARPVATSIAIAVNWGANFIVTVSFLPLTKLLDTNVFIIFVVIQALFTVFIWKKVPETKNKTIEEISSMFRQISYQ